MANDNIALAARTDDLIVKFGAMLFTKNGQDSHQHNYIKQKIREISRFLIGMRQRCENVSSLTDCINPVLFQDAIAAVKEICNYHPETGSYGVPSLALKLGHSLKKCARYLKSSAIQIQDEPSKTRAEEYRELVASEWTCEVSAQALATLHSNTFNKPHRLPLAEDLKKLNVHLTTSAEYHLLRLKNSPNESDWRKLAEITLAQVVLFNRRRGGESERILVSQYEKGIEQGKGHIIQEEIAAALSPFERCLAQKLARVEVRGKRGRKVPVLLTEAYKRQIETVLVTRDSCGISAENDYVFARSGDAKFPLCTCDVLRKFTEECGAEKPEWISSTSLGKHVATVSQLLNLKDNEMDILAGFMGHDIRIHGEFYTLPEDTLQLAKISKVLLELERGNIKKYKGMSLDQIQLEDDGIIHDEELDREVDETLDLSDLEQKEKTDIVSKKKPSAKRIDKTEAVKEYRLWTMEETAAVSKHLAKFIRLRKVPGKRDSVHAILSEPLLRKRPWQQIKYCIKNILSSQKALREFSQNRSSTSLHKVSNFSNQPQVNSNV